MSILHAVYMSIGSFVAGCILTAWLKNRVIAKLNTERAALAALIKPKG